MGLGPLASWANVVTDKWIFKYKLKANDFWTGTRIVGFYGVPLPLPPPPEVDYNETFNSVVKPATVVDPAHPQLVCLLNKSLYGLT
jgi:hypothetical protein